MCSAVLAATTPTGQHGPRRQGTQADGPAPVLDDEGHTLEPEGLGELRRPIHVGLDRMGRRRHRLVRTAETDQVGDDGPQPTLDQTGHDIPVEVGPRRLTVQQQNGLAGTAGSLVDVVHAQAVAAVSRSGVRRDIRAGRRTVPRACGAPPWRSVCPNPATSAGLRARERAQRRGGGRRWAGRRDSGLRAGLHGCRRHGGRCRHSRARHRSWGGDPLAGDQHGGRSRVVALPAEVRCALSRTARAAGRGRGGRVGRRLRALRAPLGQPAPARGRVVRAVRRDGRPALTRRGSRDHAGGGLGALPAARLRSTGRSTPRAGPGSTGRGWRAPSGPAPRRGA